MRKRFFERSVVFSFIEDKPKHMHQKTFERLTNKIYNYEIQSEKLFCEWARKLLMQ